MSGSRGETPVQSEGEVSTSPGPAAAAEDLHDNTDEHTLHRKRKLARILAGYVDDVPALASRIVRIFTSSTFTDTTNERNALMEGVYPKLKEYCRERHGLEFQVVDMRWGVRDEATDDHMTTELCMKEIENCQRVSVGPNFVVFLCQKYGYRPIPTIILGSEYEMLLEVIKQVAEDYKLITQWYKCDRNAIPPVYILQPISTILTNFNNKRHQKLMEADQNSWWEIMEKLQKMLRKAAQVLLMARKIDRDQMHNYFMSVTEREVRKGIINADNVDKHCLAFIRMINNMNLNLLRYARNFIDMAARDIDNEAQKLLSVLRDDKLPAKLCEANTGRFTVDWTGKEGIDRESHKEYLESFCEHFYSQMVKLIDNGVASQDILSDEEIYTEVQQHGHSCNNIVNYFKGREDMVNLVHEYLTNDNDQPFVLYGEGGCGKTSILAMAYSKIPEWYGKKKPVMLLRFCGKSPGSSALIPMLKSLCDQICVCYDLPREGIPDDLTPLITKFKKLMQTGTQEKPLVLCLDSLDQLSPNDGAHSLSWLPMNLSPNTKIMVSTLPSHYGILDTLKRLIINEQNYLQVTALGEQLGMDILKFWLEKGQRTLTEQQWKVVKNALSKCNLPLFVRMVYDEVQKWKSYSKLLHTTLAMNIHDSIMKLLEGVETQHGRILVQNALGYLTAAKAGLSEAELEDLLSLDERVLNDVYQYHLPPVRRIPPLLWTRIRNDMPIYLSEREADGVIVINWYHRQFIDVARERYFRNINFLSEVHSNIADYFLGIWGGVPKPFEYSELQRQRFFLDDTKGECDRKVPEQPLFFIDDKGRIIRFNQRKLSELPFHLVRSGRFEDLYKEVLFNFNWLFAKLSANPLTDVLADFDDALEHQFDKNVKIVADTLMLSASVLSNHPAMLGPQIVGRLLPYYHHYDMIRFLIQQCDTDGITVNALVPSYHCLHTPGGPLQYSLEGHPFAPFGIAITSNAKHLVSVSNIFMLFDLSTGDVFKQINPGIQGIMQNLCISPDDKTAIAYTNNSQIVVCFLMTSEYHIISVPVPATDSVRGAVLTDTHIMVHTLKQWYIYKIDGTLVNKSDIDSKAGILIHMSLGSTIDERYLVIKSDKSIPGVETEEDMILEVQNGTQDQFDFHSSIAITKDRKTLFACIALSDDAVACYKRVGSAWKYDRTLGDNYDKIFALSLSTEEKHLIGTVTQGFRLWDLKTDKKVDLQLPQGTRNIPGKNQLTGLVVFTKRSMFVVAAVRKCIYVWDVKVGNLVKTLDAHFGRVINLVSVPSVNRVISSSIDKTIKVWNFDNILEDVHAIHRHDKPIDAISLAANTYIGATTTRNCVGIWNLENGMMLKTLADSSHSSIITHAVISSDATYVVSAESGKVLTWSVDMEKVLASDPQNDIQQLMLSDSDTKCIAFSKVMSTKGKCVCRTVPGGETLYQFEFPMRKFKQAVVSCDGIFLIVPTYDNMTDMLTVYHAKTGTKLHEMSPKYADFKEWSHIVAMPHDANQVALIDEDKGNIWDIKKKHLVRSVRRWNGVCTRNGKLGLFAPTRGGLDLIELKHGRTVHTLIPRIAEGVHAVRTLFTKTDQHVIYYHTGRRSVRVFRVSDGRQIADYKAHAEINAIASTSGGAYIVLGGADGSVVALAIADPKNEGAADFIQALPSRQSINLYETTATDRKMAETTFGAFVEMARAVGKAKNMQKSRACILS